MADNLPQMIPKPLADSERTLWSLPEGWAFLNPGSFGLRLKEVQQARKDLLDQAESQPVEFLERVAPALHEKTLAVLSEMLRCDAEGIGLVSNATEAIDAVLRVVIPEGKGSILLGDQAYGAVRSASRWTVGDHQLQTVTIPLPVTDPLEIVQAWREALKSRPSLAIVDHITSSTALLQPVQEIVAACREAGVPVLVDGAHAPGMSDLDIESLGADWYAGNLHKWIGAPSGAGMLWTAPSHRESTRPLALSHDVADGYQAAFRWQGTRDITPWLCVPAAIEAVQNRWGWPALQAWQHDFACWAGHEMAEALGTTTTDASGGRMTAAMVSVG